MPSAALWNVFGASLLSVAEPGAHQPFYPLYHVVFLAFLVFLVFLLMPLGRQIGRQSRRRSWSRRDV
jgi:hypothetical protein